MRERKLFAQKQAPGNIRAEWHYEKPEGWTEVVFTGEAPELIEYDEKKKVFVPMTFSKTRQQEKQSMEDRIAAIEKKLEMKEPE